MISHYLTLVLIIFLSQVQWISCWSELSFSLLLHFQSISQSDISHLWFLGEHFEWTLFKNNIRIEKKYLFLRTISIFKPPMYCCSIGNSWSIPHSDFFKNIHLSRFSLLEINIYKGSVKHLFLLWKTFRKRNSYYLCQRRKWMGWKKNEILFL